MNNKLGVVFLLLLLALPLIHSELVPDEAAETLGVSEDVQKIDVQEKIDSVNTPQKLKENLLANEYVAKVNSWLPNINTAFLIFFNQEYDFSLLFFLTLFLWLFFGLSFFYVIKGYSSFSPWISFFIGIILSTISAHVGFISSVAQGINKFFLWITPILFGEGRSPWASFGVGVGIFLILAFMLLFLKSFSKTIKEERAKKKEQEDRQSLSNDRKIADALVKPIEKSLK